MKADLILNASRKVKKTGPSSWICCCTGHEDKSPSMTVRELDDGRVLVHCFAGCSVEEILSGAGLSFDALFPDKPQEQARGVRRPFPVADILAAVADDAMHVAVFVANLGRPDHGIEPEDYVRFLQAACRIQEARRIALG